MSTFPTINPIRDFNLESEVGYVDKQMLQLNSILSNTKNPNLREDVIDEMTTLQQRMRVINKGLSTGLKPFGNFNFDGLSAVIDPFLEEDITPTQAMYNPVTQSSTEYPIYTEEQIAALRTIGKVPFGSQLTSDVFSSPQQLDRAIVDINYIKNHPGNLRLINGTKQSIEPILSLKPFSG